MFARALYPVPARLQKLVALVLLALYVPTAGLAYAYAATARPAKLPAVYAVDAHHHVLRTGVQLQAGQRVTIYARGFAGRAQVQTVDAARRAVGEVRANRNGVAHTAFRVPAKVKPGRGRFVALAGLVATSTSTGQHGQPVGSTARRDPQPIQVTVPLLRKFAYRVGKGGHGVEGVGVGPGTGAHGGGLASTGLNVLALAAAGALLLLLGAVVLQSSRRHSTRTVSRRRVRATAPRPPRG